MKVLDLTLPLDDKIPVFPGHPKAEFKQVATIGKEGWNEKRLEFNTHFGTHIDAPFHMIPDGKKLSDFDISDFLGQAQVIDVSDQAEIVVSEEEIESEFIFFYTGHSKNIYSGKYYENNPVISLDTAHMLAHKGVKIVGIDSFSPDNEPFEVHKMLFQHDILSLENLTNLEKLIGKKFTCIILPLNILEADGSPVRVIAILN